ncbi:hypothetical protein E2C01_084344 [Portunus trituberculatus]|uniref:Uncharacterized protein n=1 Tax=Portunus trituberculatus TaxID=210409 RepID=A0A5B7J406_PORTR|nr:hypothetical protein [Portunus trituberculatus]
MATPDKNTGRYCTQCRSKVYLHTTCSPEHNGTEIRRVDRSSDYSKKRPAER